MTVRNTEQAQDIRDRTFGFALHIIKLCKQIRSSGVEKALALQLLRSATSVGANVEEAQAGQSRADFISKYAIALKEARETLYWLRLISESETVDNNTIKPLITEAGELSRILGAIVSRSRRGSS